MKVDVKYYSRKMLMALNLNLLFECLFREFGPDLLVGLSEMGEDEKNTCIVQDGPIDRIVDRVHIYSSDGNRMISMERLLALEGPLPC